MSLSVHESAIVSKKAVLNKNVTVGAFSIIHDNVVLGDGADIGNYCEIGMPSLLAKKNRLTIGKNSTIRSYTMIYSGSEIGDYFMTGHRVTVRENMQIGNGFQIGTLGDIQGDAIIGNHVKCHSNVHICKTAVIEDYVWIFPYVVLTNDPHPPSEVINGPYIESFSVIATMSVVLPGVRVGRGALIGAHSLVRNNVLPDTIIAGVPGKDLGPTKNIKHTKMDHPAYPWRRHFHKNYPHQVVKDWIDEFGEP